MERNITSKDYQSSKIVWSIIFAIIIIFALYKIGQKFLFEQNTPHPGDIEKPFVGLIAPDFIIEDISGGTALLSTIYKTKPVILVFWSTTCPYCVQELNDLNLFTQEYKDNITIIAVISGESKGVIENYIQEKKPRFPISIDIKGIAWQKYLTAGTPYHVLIEKNGKILATVLGKLSLADLQTVVKILLD